ncbi:MAG: CD225/dispanin family protein [Ginsengibacter sp.]
MPKNWLVESILVTIFCCLPFGIAGIVFASQVNSKYQTRDYAGALQASKEAAKWTKIGFFIGLAGIVIYIIVILLTGGAFFWAASHSQYR